MPVFVARNLEKLPPITFDHLDVSDLLKKLTLLQAEIREVKSSYATLDQLEEVRKEVQGLNVPVNIPSTSVHGHINVNTKRGAYAQSQMSSTDTSLFGDSTKFKSLDMGSSSSPKSADIAEDKIISQNEGSHIPPSPQPVPTAVPIATELEAESTDEGGASVTSAQASDGYTASAPVAGKQLTDAAIECKQTAASVLKRECSKTQMGSGRS